MTNDATPAQLKPVDYERCQTDVPNGYNFMTLGGRPQLERCKNRPSHVVTESAPGADGQIGSMSVCAKCMKVLEQTDLKYTASLIRRTWAVTIEIPVIAETAEDAKAAAQPYADGMQVSGVSIKDAVQIECTHTNIFGAPNDN